MVRWGTRLHDDFMLPHYVHAGFPRGAGGAGGARLPARPRLVRRRMSEFRFPQIGDDHGARRRRWNCATRWSPGTCWARKPAAGGTARYVDSSAERVQARVTGWIDGALSCWPATACAVPLSPTEAAGEYVGRRALQGLAAAERAAPDDPGAGAADVRRLRPLDRPQPGRADPSRRPSRRAQLRHLPGQRQRGRGPAALPVLPVRPYPGRRCPSRARRPAASTRARWTCAASSETMAW